MNNKLRLIYQENDKLKKDLQIERNIHLSTSRDLNTLKVEFKELQGSERIIREERSRLLHVSWLVYRL